MLLQILSICRYEPSDHGHEMETKPQNERNNFVTRGDAIKLHIQTLLHCFEVENGNVVTCAVNDVILEVDDFFSGISLRGMIAAESADHALH